MTLLPPPKASFCNRKQSVRMEPENHKWHRLACTDEVDRRPGPIEDHVLIEGRQRGKSLKPRRGLFLPDPKLANEVARNVRATRLLAAAAVRSHLVWQLDLAVCVEARARPAKRRHGAVANVVHIIPSDVDTARVTTEEDTIAITASDLVLMDRNTLSPFDCHCTGALQRPVPLTRQPVSLQPRAVCQRRPVNHKQRQTTCELTLASSVPR
eukprot:COSAG02_NODE_16074_length_1115_cov_1.229331_2_plen_211_part_00